jgi:hypothetical protein
MTRSELPQRTWVGCSSGKDTTLAHAGSASDSAAAPPVN